MPSYFRLWTQRSNIESCMYNDKYHVGLSDWELANNPWWIDFPIGSCPDDEKESYNMHVSGTLTTLVVDSEVPHIELEMGATLEDRLKETVVEVEEQIPRQRLLNRSRKGKEATKSPLPSDVTMLTPPAKRVRDSPEFIRPSLALSKTNSKVGIVLDFAWPYTRLTIFLVVSLFYAK